MTVSNKITSHDIRTKWDKFTEVEANAIKSTDALSAQLMKSYSLPKDKAHADVTAWLAGRSF